MTGFLASLTGRPALAAIAGSFWVQMATALALGIALVKGYGALRQHQGHQAGRAEVQGELKTGVAHDNELAAKARQRSAENELAAQRAAFDVPAAPYYSPREIIVRPDAVAAPAAAPAAPPASPKRAVARAAAEPRRVQGVFERSDAPRDH